VPGREAKGLVIFTLVYAIPALNDLNALIDGQPKKAALTDRGLFCLEDIEATKN